MRRTIFFLGMFLSLILPFNCAPLFAAQNDSVIVGNLRVQMLSDSLVRLEIKGPEGFEDRNTFHIVNRDWPGTRFELTTNNGVLDIHTAGYVVRIAVPEAETMDGAGITRQIATMTSFYEVSVLSTNGETLYRGANDLTNSAWLPAPADNPEVWSFADTPRIVPPPWGLTPPPRPMPNGGWDLSNNVPDVYVFIPHGDYFQLRQDFLHLTGPSEMPPLFMFGAFDSRWYDYRETTALKQIADYRSRQIPLDVLVVDTGWRQGASTGYQPNTNLFPNLPRFFREAHAQDVKVLFNDHPEPLNTNVSVLDPKEMNFRFNGLASLLKEGLDVWWYDRNWYVALVPPAPGLRKEVVGMRLYHDTTARVRPGLRPLIMANVDGIDNGMRHRPMDVAAHRFTFQWTGDIGPGPAYLRRGVENAVHAGVQSLFPYMSEDLGGHVADPAPEGYIRWIEYGALSPVYRPHCTHNHERMPWVFGPKAETIARNLLDMRYRLLPVFYEAAHENYQGGEPILRRLDLYFPEYPEARRDDEYLLGPSILVAPVLDAANGSNWQSDNAPDATRILWIPPGDWIDAWTGDTLSGPRMLTNSVPLDQIPIYVQAGAVIPLAPQMQYTSQRPWNPITLDLYPRSGKSCQTIFYEDDTRTIAYQRGEYRTTTLSLWDDHANTMVTVDIGAAQGNFRGELKRRAWILRLHPPSDWPKGHALLKVTINGRKQNPADYWLAQSATAMPFGDLAGAPDGDVYDIPLPAANVSKALHVEIKLVGVTTL